MQPEGSLNSTLEITSLEVLKQSMHWPDTWAGKGRSTLNASPTKTNTSVAAALPHRGAQELLSERDTEAGSVR